MLSTKVMVERPTKKLKLSHDKIPTRNKDGDLDGDLLIAFRLQITPAVVFEKYLEVDTETLRHLRRAGMPYTQVHQTYFYNAEEVLDYFKTYTKKLEAKIRAIKKEAARC